MEVSWFTAGLGRATLVEIQLGNRQHDGLVAIRLPRLTSDFGHAGIRALTVLGISDVFVASKPDGTTSIKLAATPLHGSKLSSSKLRELAEGFIRALNAWLNTCDQTTMAMILDEKASEAHRHAVLDLDHTGYKS